MFRVLPRLRSTHGEHVRSGIRLGGKGWNVASHRVRVWECRREEWVRR
jgi:hypothetical protein